MARRLFTFASLPHPTAALLHGKLSTKAPCSGRRAALVCGGGRLPVAAGQGALTSAGGAALTRDGAVGGCQIERAAEVRLGTSDPCITLPDELMLAIATGAVAPAQPDTRKNRASPPKYGADLRFNSSRKLASLFPCKYKMRKDVVSISVQQNEMFCGHCGGHYRYSSPQHVRAFTIPQFCRPVARGKARDLARCGRARLA